MELILYIDYVLFLFINRGLSNIIFDIIMPLFNHEIYFLPILILGWISTIFYDKNNRWKLLFLVPITILFVDQTGLYFKHYFSRPRPWVIIDSNIIHHLVTPSGTNLSFPSNHAANSAALATIFSLIYTNFKYTFWLIAFIIMISRVYIGVHYPLDIIFGCIIGVSYGFIFTTFWDKVIKNKKQS